MKPNKISIRSTQHDYISGQIKEDLSVEKNSSGGLYFFYKREADGARVDQAHFSISKRDKQVLLEFLNKPEPREYWIVSDPQLSTVQHTPRHGGIHVREVMDDE